MQNKADKIEWDGEELVSNVCLFIWDLETKKLNTKLH